MLNDGDLRLVIDNRLNSARKSVYQTIPAALNCWTLLFYVIGAGVCADSSNYRDQTPQFALFASAI